MSLPTYYTFAVFQVRQDQQFDQREREQGRHLLDVLGADRGVAEHAEQVQVAAEAAAALVRVE